MERKLYIHEEAVHNLKAPEEVVPFIFRLLNPKSVLDVGCGLGTWLQAFQALGVNDVLGVDGNYVNRDLLKIPQERFMPLDLTKTWTANRKFDLVISLEVAEHLEEKFADTFIKSLVKHGDVILFSAAIPRQGGQNHLNEQWLSYWLDKFNKLDFVMYDAVRPVFWNNKNVDVWYKQNMVIFCKAGHLLTSKLEEISGRYVNVVHPELFEFYATQAERTLLYERGELGIRSAVNALWKAMKIKF
jgi:SAM-dependent methyltransferase